MRREGWYWLKLRGNTQWGVASFYRGDVWYPGRAEPIDEAEIEEWGNRVDSDFVTCPECGGMAFTGPFTGQLNEERGLVESARSAVRDQIDRIRVVGRDPEELERSQQTKGYLTTTDAAAKWRPINLKRWDK